MWIHYGLSNQALPLLFGIYMVSVHKYFVNIAHLLNNRTKLFEMGLYIQNILNNFLLMPLENMK